LAGFPRDADLLLERGKLLKKLDRYPEALYSFSQIIELDPRHSEALKERAALKAVLGNHDEAIKDLNLAILLNPDDPYSYLNRGLVRTRQGDYLAAVQDFTAAIKLQSDLPEPYYHRANLYYFCLDQKDKAFSDYRQACRLGHSLACQQIREVDDKAAASGEAEDTAAAPAAAGEDEAVKRVQMEALKQLQDKMHEADGVAVAAAPLLQPKPKAKKPSPNLKDILLIILADVPFPVILLTLLFFFCLIEAGLLILSNDERRQKQRLQKRLQYLRGLEKRSQASLIKTDGLSQIPWLSQFLKKIRRLGQLQNLLVQADVNWSVGTFLLVTCGISAVLMSLGFFKLGNLGALGGGRPGIGVTFSVPEI
jgi:hypothetical protein